MANEGKFMQIPMSSQQSEKLSMGNLMKTPETSRASDTEKGRKLHENVIYFSHDSWLKLFC